MQNTTTVSIPYYSLERAIVELKICEETRSNNLPIYLVDENNLDQAKSTAESLLAIREAIKILEVVQSVFLCSPKSSK